MRRDSKYPSIAGLFILAVCAEILIALVGLSAIDDKGLTHNVDAERTYLLLFLLLLGIRVINLIRFLCRSPRVHFLENWALAVFASFVFFFLGFYWLQPPFIFFSVLGIGRVCFWSAAACFLVLFIERWARMAKSLLDDPPENW